jgi:hypothetical protein
MKGNGFRITHHNYKKQNIIIVKATKGKIFIEMFLRILEFKEWHKVEKGLLNHDEYVKWHKLISGESYDELFYGLYVPGPLLREFYRKYSNSLNAMEQILYDEIFTKMKVSYDEARTPKFSGQVQLLVINEALCHKDKYDTRHVFLHEFSHMLYMCNKQYNNTVNEAFLRLNESTITELITEYVNTRRMPAMSWGDVGLVTDEWAAQIAGINANMPVTDFKASKKIEHMKTVFAELLVEYNINVEAICRKGR